MRRHRVTSGRRNSFGPEIADWRWAITYFGTRGEIDEQRIGIWGFSYAGGYALVLGATDRRIRAVYAQAPTISDYETGLRRVPSHEIHALKERFHQDERDPHWAPEDAWTNEVTLQPNRRAREPKELVLTDGDHFLSCMRQFELSSTAAIGLFDTHLRNAEKNDSRHER
ncbi:acetylxylan esterase [Streptomyces sp. NPDC048462]|uniref:acetylxylan esterase n=1 Tax=Streptomyces sp. NPDC048462 TaxID=3365555 RepID=UPI0037135BC7